MSFLIGMIAGACLLVVVGYALFLAAALNMRF